MILLVFAGLLWGILTSEASEPLKYLAINILVLAIVVMYIILVLQRRIERLEEKAT